MQDDATGRHRGRRSTIIGAIVSLVILAAVFLFLFPRFADYGSAFEQMLTLSPWWIAALIAASMLNIALYPLTEIAAIPGLRYRAAFMSRQAAFTISNIVPGGGAVAVATQYSILAGYRVSPAQAAAAVSADGAWTCKQGMCAAATQAERMQWAAAKPALPLLLQVQPGTSATPALPHACRPLIVAWSN